MTANFNTTSTSDAIKRYFTEKKTQSLMLEGGALLHDVNKKVLPAIPNDMVVPILVDMSYTGAGTFSQTDTNSNAGNGPLIRSFHYSPVSAFANKTIQEFLQMTASSDATSYWNWVEMANKDAIGELSNDLAGMLYGNGWGARGVVGAVASDVITLKDPNDVFKFGNGMTLVFSQSDHSDVLRSSGASLSVISIDFAGGTIQLSAALSTVSGAGVGDSIFRAGDRATAAPSARVKVAGLQALGPSTKILSGDSDSFFGVDRSVDSRLQFSQYSGKLRNVADAICRGIMQSQQFGKGSMVKKIYTTPAVFNTLNTTAQGQVIRTPNEKNVSGFSSCFINTVAGQLEVVADKWCNANTVWGIAPETLTLYSAKQLIHRVESDGLAVRLQSDSNDLKVRYRTFHQLACSLPGANVRIDLT